MSNFISLNKAIEMTTRFRSEKENILKPEFQGNDLLLICETFDKSSFESLLAQTGCQKIRIYFSMDASMKVRAIAVAVNSSDEDILPSGGTTDVVIVEEGLPCPEFCPPPSALNG